MPNNVSMNGGGIVRSFFRMILGCRSRRASEYGAGTRLTHVLLLGFAFARLAASACPMLPAGTEPVGHITGVLGDWTLHVEGAGKSKAAMDLPLQLGCALPPLAEVRVGPTNTTRDRSIEIMLANGNLLDAKGCKPLDRCRATIPDINPSILSRLLDVVMPKLVSAPKKFTVALRSEGDGLLRDDVVLLADDSLTLTLAQVFTGVSNGEYQIGFPEDLNNGGKGGVTFRWDGTNGRVGIRQGLYIITATIDGNPRTAWILLVSSADDKARIQGERDTLKNAKWTDGTQLQAETVLRAHLAYWAGQLK